jgi:hypothetical protein
MFPARERRNAGRVSFEKDFGAVAQLGERYNGIVEVVGSIPSGSTISNPSGNRGVLFWAGLLFKVISPNLLARCSRQVTTAFKLSEMT